MASIAALSAKLSKTKAKIAVLKDQAFRTGRLDQELSFNASNRRLEGAVYRVQELDIAVMDVGKVAGDGRAELVADAGVEGFLDADGQVIVREALGARSNLGGRDHLVIVRKALQIKGWQELVMYNKRDIYKSIARVNHIPWGRRQGQRDQQSWPR